MTVPFFGFSGMFALVWLFGLVVAVGSLSLVGAFVLAMFCSSVGVLSFSCVSVSVLLFSFWLFLVFFCFALFLLCFWCREILGWIVCHRG